MLINKKLLKKFDNLLKELLVYYQGEIKYSEDYKGSESFLVIDNRHFCYPRFIGIISGMKFVVEIGFRPCSSIGLKKDFSSSEFLTITLIKDTPYNIKLSREDFFDKFQKKLKLISEFQTGSEKFDNTYLIDVESKVDEELVSTDSFQRKIVALEPFDAFRITPKVSQISNIITDLEMLITNAVSEKIVNLSRLFEK